MPAQTFFKLWECSSPCLIGEVWGGGQCRNTMMLCGPVRRWGRWGERFERLIEQHNQTKWRRGGDGGWGGGGGGGGRGGSRLEWVKAARRLPTPCTTKKLWPYHCSANQKLRLMWWLKTMSTTQMQDPVSIFSRLKTCSLCHLSGGMRMRTEGHWGGDKIPGEGRGCKRTGSGVLSGKPHPD